VDLVGWYRRWRRRRTSPSPPLAGVALRRVASPGGRALRSGALGFQNCGAEKESGGDMKRKASGSGTGGGFEILVTRGRLMRTCVVGHTCVAWPKCQWIKGASIYFVGTKRVWLPSQ
jgi:hypothetical protein